MKKNYALLLLGVSALSANAQQINGDFDATWEDCIPWDSKDGTNVKGTQPQGWHVSNIYVNKIAQCQVATSVTGSNGEGQAVKLTNGDLYTNGIPAYLTLGTPYATAEGISAKNPDGGTFGGKKFAFHPDAITFDYQRDNSKGEENASVIAYLWSGTWSQAEVPANTVLSGSANKVTMENRERNILGIDTSTGGDITKTDDAMLVAYINQSIAGSTDGEWKTDTIPFTYTDAGLGAGEQEIAKVENVNVIFSANDYFADRATIKKGNSLTIDNVKFIYYHDLTSLSTTDADGNPIDLDKEFKSDVYDYKADCAFDPDYTEYEWSVNGVGATVEDDYDEETGILTLTVKGEDYDAETNPDAKTVYTIQYTKPAPTLSSLVVAGHEFIKLGDTSTEFTATGTINESDEISWKTQSEDATVDYIYEMVPGSVTSDGASSDGYINKLIVTVSQTGFPDNVYTITFDGNKKDEVYQIPNSDFENWTSGIVGERLAESWNSFDTASGMFASFSLMSPMPERIEGVSGNGVRITSKDLYVAYANGNLTTGNINMGSTNPADAANFNFTDRTDVNGNLPFAGRPDAFEVYARFKPGTAKTLTDDEVAAGKQQPTLQGRMQLILHGDVAYHDPELAEQTDSKVASASVLIPATSEWTRFEGKFNYVTDDVPSTQYLLASATTNPVPGASMNDTLDIDNVKLIYYSTLKTLSYDGKVVEGFSPEKTEYTIKASLVDGIDKLNWEKSGVGATVSTDTDFSTNTMRLFVLGNDYSVNKDNKTVYTITFDDPTAGISSISAADAASHEVYTLGGVRVNGKPSAGIYVVDGKKMAIK